MRENKAVNFHWSKHLWSHGFVSKFTVENIILGPKKKINLVVSADRNLKLNKLKFPFCFLEVFAQQNYPGISQQTFHAFDILSILSVDKQRYKTSHP